MIYMRHLTKLKRRLAAERGFVLIAAIAVLSILLVLTTAAVAVSVDSSTSTTRDGNSKAALAAAEAGLQVASYRLKAIKPGPTECITGTGTTSPTIPTSKPIYCVGPEEKTLLGNNAEFQYWTSKVLASGENCAGAKSGTEERCITSEGKVNGASQRLQTLGKTPSEESLFTVKGVEGLNHVLISGSVKIPALVTSNGEIVGTGSSNFEQGYEICAPGGKFTPAAGSERLSSGVKIHGENPGPTIGYEKTRSSTACPFKAPIPSGHPTAASNEDSRIGVSDKLEGTKHKWNEKTYEFEMKGGSENTLTLGEAGRTTRYFFCSFKLPSGSPKFKIASGAKVEMFIGSPEETPKVCATGTGTFEIAGGAEAENGAKNPAALFITMGGKGPFTYAGGTAATLEAAIYAPNARVELSGNVGFKGGIVGYEDFLEGSSKSYEWSEEVQKITNGVAGGYERKTWEQCTPGSGAETGC